MNFFILCLMFIATGHCSKFIKSDSTKLASNPYNLDFINNNREKLVEFLNEQRIIGLVKLMEKETQLRMKRERENDIYRKRLASRVSSSVLRDFHTSRY